MHHRLRVFTGHVNGAVDTKTRRIDLVTASQNDVALQIYFHKIGSSHFIEHQTVGVDQEMVLRSGHAGRQMGKNEVRPLVVIYQPISCG